MKSVLIKDTQRRDAQKEEKGRERNAKMKAEIGVMQP